MSTTPYRLHSQIDPRSVRVSKPSDPDRPIFIYGLVRFGRVRYVGQSVEPHNRFLCHLYGGYSPELRAWRDEPGFDPESVRLIIIEVVDRAAADARERHWIAALAGKHPLLNRQHNSHCRRHQRDTGGPIDVWFTYDYDKAIL